MAPGKEWLAGFTLSLGLTAVIAAAPAPPPHAPISAAAARSAGGEAETNEQIVADFFGRKDRAEKAQKAILSNLRKALDRKRLEFEDAQKRFDEARGRYAEIVGPLPRQGVFHPEDPRLPYEYTLQRSAHDSLGPGYTSRKGAEPARK